MNKKVIKLIGNIVAIVAIIFVFKQLLSANIDYSSLFRQKNILPISFIIIIQALLVLCNAYPWTKLVNILTNREIKLHHTIPVYTKSNMYKYVPGNVFQYVGRNALATEQELSHVSIGISTFLDILLNVLAAFVMSIFFLYDYTITTFNQFKNILLPLIFIVVIMLILIFFMRNKIINWFKKYEITFQKKNGVALISCFIYYLFSMLITSLMYCIVVFGIMDVSFTPDLFLKLFSAYILSWLIGFLTPGAPAGIGVKEAVMLGVAGSLISQPTIALSMIVIRILATISDFLAFLFSMVYIKISKKYLKFS